MCFETSSHRLAYKSGQLFSPVYRARGPVTWAGGTAWEVDQHHQTPHAELHVRGIAGILGLSPKLKK